MIKTFNGFHEEVPIYVFEVNDIPTMPPGFYYVIGIDFEALDPGETELFDVPMRGPFLNTNDATEFAAQAIDEVRAQMDLLEREFAFVDEEANDCAA